MAVTDYQLAARTIAGFEGFIAEAEWDVNAYRLGDGSDTEGPDQIPVTKGMTTTRERALANLVARIPQYEATIIKQVGAGNWQLPQYARAALLSMAYNYGDLPASVAHAIGHQEGLPAISAAVKARQFDNKGVNAHRRIAEAAMILIPDEAVSSPPAPDPAPISRKIEIDLDTDKGLQQALNAMKPSRGVRIDMDGDIGPQTIADIADFCRSRGIASATAPYDELRDYLAKVLSGL